MKPYADRVAQITGIPSVVTLAHWGLETGFGTSAASQKLNNHAGIKSNSAGADYNGGTYAGYHSLDSFARDYARVMGLSYYDKVRQAGKTGNVEATVRALDQSPWAEDPQQYSKLMNIINGSTPAQTGTVVNRSGSTDLLGDIKSKLVGLSDSELKQFAMIGIGAVIVAKILD